MSIYVPLVFVDRFCLLHAHHIISACIYVYTHIWTHTHNFLYVAVNCNRSLIIKFLIINIWKVNHCITWEHTFQTILCIWLNFLQFVILFWFIHFIENFFSVSFFDSESLSASLFLVMYSVIKIVYVFSSSSVKSKKISFIQCLCFPFWNSDPVFSLSSAHFCD